MMLMQKIKEYKANEKTENLTPEEQEEIEATKSEYKKESQQERILDLQEQQEIERMEEIHALAHYCYNGFENDDNKRLTDEVLEFFVLRWNVENGFYTENRTRKHLPITVKDVKDCVEALLRKEQKGWEKDIEESLNASEGCTYSKNGEMTLLGALKGILYTDQIMEMECIIDELYVKYNWNQEKPKQVLAMLMAKHKDLFIGNSIDGYICPSGHRRFFS